MRAERQAGATIDVANELRPILVRLARELRQETTHLGITGGQATLLWHISERPGIGPDGIATHSSTAWSGESSSSVCVHRPTAAESG